MKEIKLGFAGFRHGHIFALYNAINEKDGICTVASCEENAESRKAAEEKGVVMTHETYEDMLNDDTIDAIAIGVCYGERGALAIKALRAGKHIIADKPLCTSIDEISEIKRLSSQKNLKVGIMLDLIDNPTIATAIELIAKDTIGKVNNISFNGKHPLMYGVRPSWYFEEGKHGGVITDIAIHGIDFARIITKSDVESVVGARCWNHYAKEAPHFLDSAQLMVRMGNGCGVISDVSYAAPNSQGYAMPAYWRFEISGEKGTIVAKYNDTNVELYLEGEENVRMIPAVSPEKTYFDRFISDVSCGTDNTSEYIKSMEQTIEIQIKAENR